MKENFRCYGEFIVGDPIPTERADHILGCRIELDAKGKPDQVAIQFQSVGGPRELQMDFVQAMFVLSCLKSIQLDVRVPFPDDPRANRNNPLC